jgi:hypothetical protein
MQSFNKIQGMFFHTDQPFFLKKPVDCIFSFVFFQKNPEKTYNSDTTSKQKH